MGVEGAVAVGVAPVGVALAPKDGVGEGEEGASGYKVTDWTAMSPVAGRSISVKAELYPGYEKSRRYRPGSKAPEKL